MSRAGLGTPADLLPLSVAALAISAHDESRGIPLCAVRLRTDAAKRFKKVANVMAVIWKMLRVAEQTFRRMKHPELMIEVYRGVKCVDGKQDKTEVPASLCLHTI